MTNKKFKRASKAARPTSDSATITTNMAKSLKTVADTCAALESQIRSRKVN